MSRFSLLLASILVLPLSAGIALGRSTLSYGPSPSPAFVPESNGFLQFHFKSGDDADTYRMLDAQARLNDSGSRNPVALQDHINNGQARAQAMMNMLKDQEMQGALQKVTAQGRRMLQENPDLKNPATIIGASVALWVGRTVRLIKGDAVNLETHIEGRARSGDFSLKSPLLNTKFAFNANDGLNVSMDRSIASIHTRANVNYSARLQVFTGELSHSLTRNLDLTFGAGQNSLTNQTDGQARIEYRLSF